MHGDQHAKEFSLGIRAAVRAAAAAAGQGQRRSRVLHTAGGLAIKDDAHDCKRGMSSAQGGVHVRANGGRHRTGLAAGPAPDAAALAMRDRPASRIPDRNRRSQKGESECELWTWEGFLWRGRGWRLSCEWIAERRSRNYKPTA